MKVFVDWLFENPSATGRAAIRTLLQGVVTATIAISAVDVSGNVIGLNGTIGLFAIIAIIPPLLSVIMNGIKQGSTTSTR